MDEITGEVPEVYFGVQAKRLAGMDMPISDQFVFAIHPDGTDLYVYTRKFSYEHANNRPIYDDVQAKFAEITGNPGIKIFKYWLYPSHVESCITNLKE